MSRSASPGAATLPDTPRHAPEALLRFKNALPTRFWHLSEGLGGLDWRRPVSTGLDWSRLVSTGLDWSRL
eukprot:5663824-Lingulodinium_polyedra.AAC.1